MRSPYNFVGGQFEAEGNGAMLEVSEDGKKWVSTEKDARGTASNTISFRTGDRNASSICSAASSRATPG